VGQHFVVRKAADESVTSSAVLQDDNDLILPVLANEVWLATWYLVWTAAAAGDLNTRFTFPSGTIAGSSVWVKDNDVMTAGVYSATSSPSLEVSYAGAGATVIGPVPVSVLYTGGGTGGNVTLQWAQKTSDATATVMKANSSLWAVKLV
jgi:hypothetical protein